MTPWPRAIVREMRTGVKIGGGEWHADLLEAILVISVSRMAQ